jgi:hypothetical protein
MPPSMYRRTPGPAFRHQAWVLFRHVSGKRHHARAASAATRPRASCRLHDLPTRQSVSGPQPARWRLHSSEASISLGHECSRLDDGFLSSHCQFCGMTTQTKDSECVVNQLFEGIVVICKVGHARAFVAGGSLCRPCSCQLSMKTYAELGESAMPRPGTARLAPCAPAGSLGGESSGNRNEQSDTNRQ